MKWMLLAVLATVAACGGSSETPEQRLIGQWIYTNGSGEAAVDITFNADSTYKAQDAQLTSNTSANDEVETGIFSATDTEITSTPQQWTCPGPYPAYTVSYQFNGDSLVVTYSTGVMTMSRNTTPASSNANLTFGCFQSDGSFVTEPLAHVSN